MERSNSATDPPRRVAGDERLVLHTRVVTGAGGGPDKTIINSPRFLSERGYHMICAYMRAPDDPGFAVIEERARQAGTRLEAIDDRGAFDCRVLHRLDALCARINPDIWHAHDYKSNILGVLLARKHRMQLVTTTHGWVERDWKLPLYYALDRFSLRQYAHVVCVSEDLREACLRAGVKPHACTYVPNGIDTLEYERALPLPQAKARTFPKASDKLVLGAIGRLSEEKGFRHLIRATARLSQDFPIYLWIAGEGTERPRLQRLIQDLGLTENVTLLGFVRDVKPYIEATDIFVSSSLREGIANVILEAMALGTPIIATRVAGTPALIEDGESGLLVEPDAEQHLTGGMSRLLSDEVLRVRLAKAARARVEQRFSFHQRMERIGDIYDTLWTT